jgi:hypothetical protein
MPSDRQTIPPITRRRLVQAGAAGAATVWLGGLSRFVPDAGASPLTASLKRSTYLGLADRGFKIAIDGSTVPLRLAGVEDLPVAASVPALQGSDAAFSVRFVGSGFSPFEGGTRTLSHPEIGTFQLFVSPVEARSATQTYEAVVDRTIRIPGINEEGAPEPVDPGKRGGGGASAKPAVAAGAKIVKASLVRSRSGRKVVADVTLSSSGKEVRALLLRRGKVVGKAAVKGGRARVRLRFRLKSAARADSKFELALTVVDKTGRVSSLGRKLRLR